MKKIKEYIFSIIAWFFGLWAFIFGALAVLAVGIFHTGRVFERVLKFTCRWVVAWAGVRLKLTNTENVDPQKQYIIMMNHVNLMDPFVFYARYPGKVRAVEEESHLKWPLYGRLVRRIGQVPINRKVGRKALEALKKAGELIRRKKVSIVVLPEGTRTLTGKLGNFKKGGFLLALEADLDILPIIQLGAARVKRKGNWLIRPGKVELLFEKPIPTSGYTKENINELMEKTRNIFLEYVE